ncbi:hypothetical protein Tco_0580808, partial [Tanacetum coccineum]
KRLQNFRGEKICWDMRYARINDTIKLKLMRFKVKLTEADLHVAKLWNVGINIQKSHRGTKDQ